MPGFPGIHTWTFPLPYFYCLILNSPADPTGFSMRDEPSRRVGRRQKSIGNTDTRLSWTKSKYNRGANRGTNSFRVHAIRGKKQTIRNSERGYNLASLREMGCWISQASRRRFACEAGCYSFRVGSTCSQCNLRTHHSIAMQTHRLRCLMVRLGLWNLLRQLSRFELRFRGSWSKRRMVRVDMNY